LLSAAERSMSTGEPATPLVIEAATRRDLGFLEGLLKSRSAELVTDVATHGAILLRGFEIGSDADFSTAVLSIPGMVGMDRMFMAEDGRTAVAGERYVVHSNAIYTTGGSFQLSAFHSENFFSPDVPRYISFFCHVPSWLGGETGLVNTAAVYADLPEDLQNRLAQQAHLARIYALEEVALRYGLPADGVRQLCTEVGMPVVKHQGKEYILLYKPSVLIHSLTGEPALSISWRPLVRLGYWPAIRQAFRTDYLGKQWSMHKLLWNYPTLQYLVPSMSLIRGPRIALRNVAKELFGTVREGLGWQGPYEGPADSRVDSALAAGDLEIIVAALRRRFASFRWQRGDVLIVDNAKMAHAGMPGFGPRRLRALLCNPMAIPYAPDSPGRWQVPQLCADETVGAKIEKLQRQFPRDERRGSDS
jgi:alpha-ketoglutarate-dependent taurine dioxygenase